ncbi:hypothetical protein CORC01_07158 [Colletotrichum orchidophilum]|uniref:Uncharacterized protein n=1 Tax=Colletotrichum orchidophilum TaxID=1209926 RepID=A0A1G4B8B6_9PEZI|nr:uncharacterized protein CORC01_07158 [Colletotrichum orchidophilum]OHE97543.1 hypothetical protein CORC01_07158 [Colletotrichum orchidophilum]
MLPLDNQTGPFNFQITVPAGFFPLGHWHADVLFLSCLVEPLFQFCLDRPWSLRLRERQRPRASRLLANPVVTPSAGLASRPPRIFTEATTTNRSSSLWRCCASSARARTCYYIAI